jgi:hypothetical protein
MQRSGVGTALAPPTVARQGVCTLPEAQPRALERIEGIFEEVMCHFS